MLRLVSTEDMDFAESKRDNHKTIIGKVAVASEVILSWNFLLLNFSTGVLRRGVECCFGGKCKK